MTEQAFEHAAVGTMTLCDEEWVGTIHLPAFAGLGEQIDAWHDPDASESTDEPIEDETAFQARLNRMGETLSRHGSEKEQEAWAKAMTLASEAIAQEFNPEALARLEEETTAAMAAAADDGQETDSEPAHELHLAASDEDDAECDDLPDGEYYLYVQPETPGDTLAGDAASTDAVVHAEPSAGQLSAIEWLRKNHATLVPDILDALLPVYQQIKAAVCQQPPKFVDSWDEVFLEAGTPEALGGLVALLGVHVFPAEDGVATLGFDLHCRWDEMNGCGVLVREGQVIEIETADAGTDD